MKVGIDLGTTYSLVGTLDSDGKPILFPDSSESSVFHTPSVVCVTRGCAFVGRVAETLLEQDPQKKVARFFKRQLGETAPIFFDEQHRAWHPDSVAALVLKKLRFDAESDSSRVDSAVITVPAHFNDPQRKAVLAAANIADVPILGLVEEPVAAALHYGISRDCQRQVVLVYDWGGGTFDATVLTMDDTRVTVLAKHGLTDLGGKEIDDKIGEMIVRQFELALGTPTELGARDWLQLRRMSEEIKIELCMPTGSRVSRTVWLAGKAVEIDISREDFEVSVRELVERTEHSMHECLRGAGLQPEDVNVVLLVGGSSFVPAVAKSLRQIFSTGQEIRLHEPTHAVAFGAALHAGQLGGDAGRHGLPPELRGVTGYSVGVRTVNAQTGRVSIDRLIRPNMPLPASRTKPYFTTRATQDRIVLELVQYRESENDAVSIGQLVVGPLSSPRENYPIEVTVENRKDGTVAVTAYDAQTGEAIEQAFNQNQGVNVADLAAKRALVRETQIAAI